METITLEIIDRKALSVLKELEKLNLIKIQKRKKQLPVSEKLSQRFAGKLSLQTGDELEEHINQSRNEWERNI